MNLGRITLDLFLYGALARYVKSEIPGCANLKYTLPENSTIKDLLENLKIPTQERGITFINGNLSALPGIQHDLWHMLKDKDRVAFFDLKSMWPFQYRQGAQMTEELSQKLASDSQKGIHHSYIEKDQVN
jgi:sulfur carrier protein ThiS